jgi:ribA/ribD-fused uncharacterized protein
MTMTLIVGAITSFSGKYRFLSNFYPCEVKHDGIVYPSAEHAYQASKTDSIPERERIASLPTASAAKKAGRSLKMYSGFEANKVDTMRSIVFKKFAQNPELEEKLLETGNKFLVEGNNWDDIFWGVTDDGYGRNILGQILMETRERLS